MKDITIIIIQYLCEKGPTGSEPYISDLDWGMGRYLKLHCRS